MVQAAAIFAFGCCFAFGYGGYVHERIAQYNLLDGSGVLDTYGKPISLGRLDHSPESYLDVYNRLDNDTDKNLLAAWVWTKIAGNRTSIRLSHHEFHIRSECVEILKTNVFAASDCKLPLQCMHPQWKKLTDNWFGMEIGICYSFTGTQHVDSKSYGVLVPNNTYFSAVIAGMNIVHVELPPYVILLAEGGSIGAMHLGTAVAHPELHPSWEDIGHSHKTFAPDVYVVDEKYCVPGLRPINTEIFFSFDVHGLLEELDPLLFIIEPPKQRSTCEGDISNLLFTSESRAFYGSLHRQGYCSKLIYSRPYSIYDSENCFDIVSSYSDPLLKPIKYVVTFFLKTLQDTLSFLFEDIEELVKIFLDFIVKILSAIYKLIYDIFTDYLVKFIVVLTVLYIYDTKLIRDVIIAVTICVVSYTLTLV